MQTRNETHIPVTRDEAIEKARVATAAGQKGGKEVGNNHGLVKGGSLAAAGRGDEARGILWRWMG